MKEIWYRGKNIRDSAQAGHETTTYTPVQKVWNLMIFKRRLESSGGSVTVRELLTAFNKGNQGSGGRIPGQEEMAESFIDAAVTVWDRVISKQELRDEVLALEEKYGSQGPLNSVYKLNEVVKIGRTHPGILFIIQGLADLMNDKALSADDTSVRALNGKGNGGKGLGHILLYKRDAADQLRAFVHNNAGFAPEFKQEYNTVFQNFSSFRSRFGFQGQEVDLTWLGAWPGSAQMVVRMTEARGS